MQNAIITGCSSGFGYITALELARYGIKVWATMRDSNGKNRLQCDDIKTIAAKENLNIVVADLDVTKESSFRELRELISGEDGKLDILVNNAGYSLIGISEAYSLDQVKAQFDTNFFGVVRSSQAFLPLLRKSDDSLIVNISSLAGRLVFPYFGFYCSSKFALEAYSESLKYELKPLGIDVSIIEPGPYPTNPTINRIREDYQEVVEKYGDSAKVPDAMIKAFEDLYKDKNAPDPKDLPDTIINLIQMPNGKRPIRQVLGLDYGVRELNTMIAPIQENHVRINMEMGHLLD